MGERLFPDGLNGCRNSEKRLRLFYMHLISADLHMLNSSITQFKISFINEIGLSQ